MAYNHSVVQESTLLDYFWSLVENCTDNGRVHDHGNYAHSPRLSRRTRPHVLAYFSPSREEGTERNKPYHYMHITREEGTERKPDHHKHITSGRSLSRVIEDNDRIHELEVKLKAVAEVNNLQVKASALRRVGEWRLEQLRLMIAEKSLKGDSRFAADLSREDAPKNTAQAPNEAPMSPSERPFGTMQELLKLHNIQREKWKAERDKWRTERENWKLTCKKLKDDTCVREQQLRKLTMESQRWKAEFTKLATAESEGKDVAEVCKDLLGQLQLEQQNLDLRRRPGDWHRVLNSQTSIGKLETSSDATSGQSTQSNSDKWKGKQNKQKVDEEDAISLQELFNLEQQMWQAESGKLRKAEFESKKLEELCRGLVDQLEQQNEEIKSNKEDLQKASKWHALAQQEINEHKEEIKRLTKIQVAECIICMNEFGEDPDQQRAYWKDCNHANICYKCTKTLWCAKSRNCPTCKTPASSIPTRLPPKIYL